MNSNVAQIILIAIILVATMGVFFIASACRGTGMQALFGMNMEGCLSALTHPILAFAMIFAATSVAMGALVLAPARAFLVGASGTRFTERADATWYKNLNYERRDSVLSFIRQVIVRGTFQNREDSDSFN